MRPSLVHLQEQQAEPHEQQLPALVVQAGRDGCGIAIKQLRDRVLDRSAKQAVAGLAAGHTVAAVLAALTRRQRDLLVEESIAPEDPARHDVLVVEVLPVRRAADEAAIAVADVADEARTPEQQDAPVLADDGVVLSGIVVRGGHGAAIALGAGRLQVGGSEKPKANRIAARLVGSAPDQEAACASRRRKR
jgi:hypothetical protein